MPQQDLSIARQRVLVLIGSVSMLFITGGAMFMIVVALKDMATDFSWPREVPSLAFSLQFVGSGFGGLIMGRVVDRWGFGVPALLATGMVSVGAMLVSEITAAWQLYMIYLIMFGLSGQGALAAPALANISRWYSEHRGKAVGIVSSGQALAGIVWLPVFGYVMLQIGWRDMFFWYGVFSLCVMLPLCLIVRHKPPPPKPLSKTSESKVSAGQPIIPMSNNSIQCGLSVAIFGCCIAMALPLGHLVSFVTDRGHPIQNAVEVQSVMLLSAFVSRAVLLGLISDRWGGMRALLIFSLAQTIMLTIFTITHSLWALYVVAALFGLGYGGLFPVYTVAIRDHLPIGEIGRRTGIVFFVGAVAMGIGGWLGGYLFDQTGSYTAPFLLGAGFNAANVILVIYMIYRLRDVLPGKLVRV
ncbi:MAG: hypothetical protein CMM75_03845 [Rhodospirillaceae bacterium]|nr:hypothetical protein [Rhodospirillaceae bacterium]